ncbi:Ag2 [Aphelenchoides avenae]|nr:Ag2 [Aphelenchus avenae]
MLLVATLLILTAGVFTQQKIPPFLRGAPRYAVEEFQQIMADGTPKTYTQIMAELDEWMKTLPDDVQEKYARFKDYLRVRQAQMKIAHAASVVRFSPAAKKVDAKLWAIANNQSLPVLEKRRQINAILAASEPAIRQEIETEMRGTTTTAPKDATQFDKN